MWLRLAVGTINRWKPQYFASQLAGFLGHAALLFFLSFHLFLAVIQHVLKMLLFHCGKVGESVLGDCSVCLGGIVHGTKPELAHCWVLSPVGGLGDGCLGGSVHFSIVPCVEVLFGSFEIMIL